MKENKWMKISLLSIVSMLVLHFLSYSPYGAYPHNLAIISSFFVFQIIYRVVFAGAIAQMYFLPYILLSWLYFQSPFLLEEKTYYFMRIIDEKYIDEIATYTCISIVLLFFGFYLFFNKSVKPLTDRSFKLNNSSIKKTTLLFLVLGVTYRLGTFMLPSVFAQLSNVVQILFYSSTITFAFYVLYLLRARITPQFNIYHVLVISYLFVELLLRVSTTLISEVGILFLGVFIVYYREKRRIPITWFLIILIVGLPLYQSRKYFRFEENINKTDYSKFERGLTIVDKVYTDESEFSGSDIEEFRRAQIESKHNRFENLSFISHVVLQHKTGHKPFLNGETFYWLPLVPIPRIIYPSKPKNVMSTEVATDYGVRGKDSVASINFPMLIEGYINFGFNGMLVMALLFGMAYKWFVMKFGAGVGDLNLLMIINASKQFTHAEGNITLVFGALIQVFLFWWVLVKVFNLGKVNESKG